MPIQSRTRSLAAIGSVLAVTVVLTYNLLPTRPATKPSDTALEAILALATTDQPSLQKALAILDAKRSPEERLKNTVLVKSALPGLKRAFIEVTEVEATGFVGVDIHLSQAADCFPVEGLFAALQSSGFALHDKEIISVSPGGGRIQKVAVRGQMSGQTTLKLDHHEGCLSSISIKKKAK